MGVYTEILIRAHVKWDIPSSIKLILNYLFNNESKEPEELPDHPYFRCLRWRDIGSSSSYYHIPWSDGKYQEGIIFSRSDLKNYDNELDKFFDWIGPYLNESEGKCIGYKWYEEDNEPTLVFKLPHKET